MGKIKIPSIRLSCLNQEVHNSNNQQGLFLEFLRRARYNLQNYNYCQFHIDAKKGVIMIDDGVEVEPVIETYDLYGER